jgi:purine nucleosidase
MPDRIPLLIDTDPGVDDAWALLMAFASPAHRVLGLTITAGNVGLEHTVRNALKLCEVAGVDVPVFPGCAVPLVFPAEGAAYVHGRDGFGDTGYLAAACRAEAEHAALAMIRFSHAHPGLLLVCLGPLTNLSLALRLDPTLPSRIGRLVVMGGAVTGRGNTSVSAEFNVAFDPEAAHIVFEAFPAFDLVDWEAVLRHGLPHVEVEQWLAAPTAKAAFYQAISRRTREWSEGRRGDHWHSADGLAMAAALEPEGATGWSRHAIEVETGGRRARGATLVDWADRSGRPARVRILASYDPGRFRHWLRLALA